MFALERQSRILELLSANGAVFVSKLSEEFDVTEETVRRDLEKLEKKECLRRTHGGAVPMEGTTYDFSLEKRRNTSVDEKIRLAKIAANYVASGDTIFLDASTTTFFMASELKKLKNITVITNSLNVVTELAGIEEIKVIAVGGMVSKNQSLVGTMAEQSIGEHYWASKMFFSSKGVTETAGILESNEQECGIKTKMIENAKTKYYLCDRSKIGRVGFIKLANFDAIDFFITESELDDSFRSKLFDSDVTIVNE